MAVELNGPRILRLRGAWHHRWAYARDPGMADLGFASQQAALDGLRLAFTSSMAAELRHLGVDIHDVVHDVPELREAWFAEHGRPVVTGDDSKDLVHSAIAHLRPDIVFEQAFGLLTPDDRRDIRRRFPFVRHFVVHSVGASFKKAAGVDLVLAGCEFLRDQYLRLGVPDVRLLRHGFDATLLDELRTRDPLHEVVFTGTSGSLQGKAGAVTNWTHWSRYTYLDALMARTPLECWVRELDSTSRGGSEQREGASGDGALNWRGRFLEEIVRAVSRLPLGWLVRARRATGAMGIGAWIEMAERDRRARMWSRGRHADRVLPPENRPPDDWTEARPLRESWPARCHAPVFGLEMFQLLRDSRIVFHRGGDSTGDCAGALRLFEVTGVGSLLLTNAVPELEELFEPGVEVVTYESIDDCVALVRDLLADEPRRASIAAAGQARTLRDHTIALRAVTLRDELFDALAVR